ncbi:TPA: trp operon leader peptide [Citrobacter braakii]
MKATLVLHGWWRTS